MFHLCHFSLFFFNITHFYWSRVHESPESFADSRRSTAPRLHPPLSSSFFFSPIQLPFMSIFYVSGDEVIHVVVFFSFFFKLVWKYLSPSCLFFYRKKYCVYIFLMIFLFEREKKREV